MQVFIAKELAEVLKKWDEKDLEEIITKFNTLKGYNKTAILLSL